MQTLTPLTGGGFTAQVGQATAWSAGDVIGEIVVTNYIRFHARVTNSVISLAMKEQRLGHKMLLAKKARDANKENAVPQEEAMECAESQFSYAELQQQLHQMMQNKAT